MSLEAFASAPATRKGPYGLLVRALSHPRAGRAVVALSFLLLLTSLTTGLTADDYIHKMIAQGSHEIPGFAREPLDMFRFTSGESTRQLMRDGIVSWWADPGVRLAFFRPLSSLTHFIDYTLWPEAAWVMYLHSSLWALLLIVGVWSLYRRIVPVPWVAALALVFYALDDGRAWFVSWIAARNAVIATALSVWALVYHHRARASGCRTSRLLAPLAYALSLLGSEGATAICAYLFAYAVFLDRGTRRARLGSLVPFAAVTLLWWVVYRSLGYGVRGSGLYFDPLREPLAFAAAVVERAPVLLFSEAGGPWSDAYTGLYAYPMAMHLWWLCAIVALAVLGSLLWSLWPRSPLVRFGLSGALLSVLPACAVFSADRMLSWVGLGLSLAFAEMVASYLQDPHSPLLRGARRRVARVVVGLVVVSQVVVAPPFLASRARGAEVMRGIIGRAQAGVPSDPGSNYRDLSVFTSFCIAG